MYDAKQTLATISPLIDWPATGQQVIDIASRHANMAAIRIFEDLSPGTIYHNAYDVEAALDEDEETLDEPETEEEDLD